MPKRSGSGNRVRPRNWVSLDENKLLPLGSERQRTRQMGAATTGPRARPDSRQKVQSVSTEMVQAAFGYWCLIPAGLFLRCLSFNHRTALSAKLASTVGVAHIVESVSRCRSERFQLSTTYLGRLSKLSPANRSRSNKR